MQGYEIARKLEKNIVFLETIDEQIEVLESLSHKRIIEFLKRVNQWREVTQDYEKCYLNADLEQLKSKGLRFPSRHHSVIDDRDRIFFERMTSYLKEGNAVACVGAPHVRGLCKLLQTDGYQIRGPGF